MKTASEFIAEIQALIDEHGDLQLVDASGLDVEVEYNDDDDEAVFVVE